MAEIGDYQFQAPPAGASGAGAGGPRGPRAALMVAALVIVAAVAGWFVLGQRSNQAGAPAPAVVTPQAATPPADDVERIALPAVDASDPLVRQRVGLLSSHPLVSAWLAGKGLARTFVVVIDNISHGTTPSRHLLVLRPGGAFRVVTRGTRTVVDSRNYDRYGRLVAAAMSIDPRAAARTYGTFKPLLQAAFDELGNQEPLDRALERGIVALLQVPAVDGEVEVALAGEGIGYEYKDARLATLNGAQKQLLRMGPTHVRAIQQQLRLFAIAIGIPAQRLS